jgi:hypothetical protein
MSEVDMGLLWRVLGWRGEEGKEGEESKEGKEGKEVKIGEADGQRVLMWPQ